MRFVVAGGGVAGLAAALAVARAGHEAVVLERDRVEPRNAPQTAGDALCHTDPAFGYGLSLSLAHAAALADAAADGPDAVPSRYRSAVCDEAIERYVLACEIDDARARRWSGEALDIGRAGGCYPLFSFAAAIAAAPHDDAILRRTVRRIGLLDRTAVFDQDTNLHRRVEEKFAQLAKDSPPPAGPGRAELLSRLVVPALDVS